MALSVHPAVKRDVLEAGRYYHGVSTSVAADFFQSLRETYERIAANPRRYHFISPRHRRANLKQFPTTFFTKSRWTARRAFWWSGMIADILPSA